MFLRNLKIIQVIIRSIKRESGLIPLWNYFICKATSKTDSRMALMITFI